MTSSLSELRRQGVTFEAAEAVAIVQQLINAVRDDADEVEPPYGPPSADNVFLKDDGSVVCRGCGSTPVVSEIGRFLDSLLASGAGRVPGGLRYTIARALLNVDVPPFDSLTDLSRDLERHERGDRAAVVRSVVARARGVSSDGLATVERRRSRAAASTSELRRALRDAEVRLYERESRLLPVPIDVTPVEPRGRTLNAAAACLAAGLALIGAGEFMHSRQAPIVLQPTAPAVAQLPAPAGPIAEPRGIIVVHDASASLAHSSRPEVHRIALRRTSAHPTAAVIRTQPQSRRQPRSMLDRLKLGWLRSAFSVHSDL
jgi:hypothetical protein